ncbi:hypothetical protein LCGC14_1523570 [marine sediment metagenome]|uniref:Uncharacterized protein n=1 Tax=marine sediment metagenome TaxID=412755 RepID=A0A0F9LDF6_9ZZZZ
MGDDLYKDFLKHYSPQFGEIAVGMKFVTERQLNEALVEQVEDDFSNKPLIGYIFLKNGWMTLKQFSNVLDISFETYV